TDFGIFRKDGDNAVRSDFEKCERREGRLWSSGSALCQGGGYGLRVDGDKDAASRERADSEKCAAIEKSGLHGTPRGVAGGRSLPPCGGRLAREMWMKICGKAEIVGGAFRKLEIAGTAVEMIRSRRQSEVASRTTRQATKLKTSQKTKRRRAAALQT